MKIIFYSTNPLEKKYLTDENKFHQLNFCFEPLNKANVHLAEHFDVVSVCAADIVSVDVLRELKSLNVRFILVRAKNFENIDVDAARHIGITVADIPALPGKSFFIKHRLEHIATTTFATIDRWTRNQHSPNELTSHQPEIRTKQFTF